MIRVNADTKRAQALSLGCGALVLIAIVGGVLLQGRYPVFDNAMFEYVGRAIAHGRRLYLDVWDNKLPGVYYINAAWQVLFGQNYELHAVAEASIAFASGTLLALVLRSFGLRRWLPASTVLLLLLCLVFQFNTTEAYALPLLLAAILGARRRGLSLLSGALVGIAALFWLPSLLMLVPLSVLLPKKSWLMLGLSALAVLLAVFAALASMLHSTGLLALIHSWFVYVSTPPVPEEHHQLLILNDLKIAWSALANLWEGSLQSGAALFIAVLAVVVRRPSTQAQRFGLAWTAAMLAGTFAGVRFWAHYFLPSLAAMLFTTTAYGPRRLSRFLYVPVLVICSFIAVRSLQEMYGVWAITLERSALTARIGNAMESAVAKKLTLEVDSYRPELYLALDPRLRSPYEIAERPNDAFLRNKAFRPQSADITIRSTKESNSGVRICPRTGVPLRIFASARIASRFAACP
jgi:hypothetical protein